MWPFTRKLPPAASKGPAAMPAPMMRDDWKFQPPVQRAIGQHPLTAPSDEFARQLATHQDPSVVSRTLGHHVSMDGPAGLVLAIATPGRRQDGPAMVSRPRVQRRAATIDATDLEFPEEAQDAAVSQPLPGPPSRELPILPGPPEVQRLTRIAPGAEPVPIGPGRSVRSEPIEIQRSTPAASGDEVTGPAPAMMDDAQAAIQSFPNTGHSGSMDPRSRFEAVGEHPLEAGLCSFIPGHDLRSRPVRAPRSNRGRTVQSRAGVGCPAPRGGGRERSDSR